VIQALVVVESEPVEEEVRPEVPEVVLLPVP
jgi:hypothetical protein